MQRKNSIIFFLVGIFIVTIVFFQLSDTNRTTLVYISLFCNFISIYGVVLAYFQILSLKDLSLKTSKAVAASSLQLQKVLSISELSKSKKLIEEIQHFLHSDNLNGALIRMMDLKETLIQNRYNKDLSRFTLLKTYKTIITNTAIDI